MGFASLGAARAALASMKWPAKGGLQFRGRIVHAHADEAQIADEESERKDEKHRDDAENEAFHGRHPWM